MDTELFELNIDQDEIEPIPVLSVGEHEFEVRKAEHKESNRTPGNYYFNFMLVCLDEPGASPIFHMVSIPNENTKNVKLTNNNLIAFFKACGIDHKKPINLDDFIGTTIRATVKHEEYEGNTQARIIDIL